MKFHKMGLATLTFASLLISACSDSKGHQDEHQLPNNSSLDQHDHANSKPSDITLTISENSWFDLSDIKGFDFNLENGLDLLEKPSLGQIVFNKELFTWIYQAKANVAGIDYFELGSLSLDGSADSSRIKVIVEADNDSSIQQLLNLRIPQGQEIEVILPAKVDTKKSLNVDILAVDIGAAAIDVGDSTALLRYESPYDFAGTVVISYQVRDEFSSRKGHVVFEVLEDRDRSLISDRNFQTRAGQDLVSRIQIPRIASEAVRFEVIEQPRIGTLILNEATGHFQYRPRPQTSGEDHFTYRVWQGDTPSNVAKALIQIQQNHEAPYGSDASFFCSFGRACTQRVQGGQLNNYTITFHLADQPAYGTISDWNPNTGEFTYIVDSRYSHIQQDFFYYWVEDCFGYRSGYYLVMITFDPYSF